MKFTNDEYLTIRQFCEKYPFLKESQLRWIIFNKHENHAGNFLRLLGRRRLLIHCPSFFKWLDERSGGEHA